MSNALDPSPRMIERFDEILDYLRTKTDTQAGFFAAIRKQKSDLKLFGAMFADLIEENRKLNASLALPVPEFIVNTNVSHDLAYADRIIYVEFRMQKEVFKFAMSQQQVIAWRFDDGLRRKLRWGTYLGMCRRIRAMLDRSLHEAKL
jgi:hypothetical protein